MRTVRVVASVVRPAVVAVCLLSATPGLAQERGPAVGGIAETSFTFFTLAPLPDAAAPAPSRWLVPAQVQKPERPSALLPLYGSLIALQSLDVHSTRRNLASGGREANPAMRHVVQHGAAYIAVKASATVGVIWASEKMWKKNRKAAVVFTAAINTAMAAVVAHNYRVSR